MREGGKAKDGKNKKREEKEWGKKEESMLCSLNELLINRETRRGGKKIEKSKSLQSSSVIQHRLCWTGLFPVSNTHHDTLSICTAGPADPAPLSHCITPLYKQISFYWLKLRETWFTQRRNYKTHFFLTHTILWSSLRGVENSFFFFSIWIWLKVLGFDLVSLFL